ncbi:MAG: GGDEF domain-containing protein [Candidatus Limnocylindrales bacterium]
MIDLDDARAWLRRIVQLLEAKEYYAVGGSPRYLAVQRLRTWGASRAAMLVVAAAAPVDILMFSLLHPAHAGFFLVLDGALGILALAGWWALGHLLRRRPELVAFSVSLAVMFAVMAIALDGPRLVNLAIAYLMFLPTLVALVIPWRTTTEVRWLAAYGTAGVLFLALVPAASLSASDRSDLVLALVMSLIASFVGHVLLFRHQVRTFSHMQAIGSLHRSENNQRVELQRVHRSLEITARTDELTQVGNRMKLEEDLVSMRATIARTGRPIGLLEIDLDQFKGVNDLLGHLAGDAVLREVARAIRNTCRGDDLVFRYGGEEFLVILGNISGGVGPAGERLRVAVENLGLAHPGNPPFGLVTISVGAAALGPADLALTADEWFARVDAALYEAKDAGRNVVAVAHGPTAEFGADHRADVDRRLGSVTGGGPAPRSAAALAS